MVQVWALSRPILKRLSISLCKRLKERGIPFLIHSGYPQVEGVPDGALHISKPATPKAIVKAMERLIRDAEDSNYDTLAGAMLTARCVAVHQSDPARAGQRTLAHVEPGLIWISPQKPLALYPLGGIGEAA
jgi:hypothetical protein